MLAGRKTEHTLNLYPVAGGAPTIIPLQYFALGAKWLPDQSGLVLTTSDSTTGPEQVWIKPLPTGKSQRLTNDLDTYGSPSVTSDGALIAAVQIQTSLTMFVAPASKPEQGTAIRTGKSEGIGLIWTRGGNLLSHSLDGEISSLMPDGKERVALFKDEAFDFALCGDAHLIFSRVKGGDSSTIWFSDMAGRGAKQLTDGTLDFGADCSPGGKSVIFIRRVGSKYQLFKSDTLESTPKQVSKRQDMQVADLRYSPDGHSIADIEFDDKDKSSLVIRNAETGEPTKSFAMPTGFSLPWNSSFLRWTPDGKTLTYALWRGPGSPTNLWNQSVAGGSPRQITNFPDSVIAYDWSPDGKQLAYTRSASIRDVVLISNFR
jgi:Tol biopolymer transport system component